MLANQIPDEEYQALIKLYDGTAGQGWDVQWNLSKNDVHEGKWYGVTVEDGHIVELRLPNNYLRGTIPDEIGTLTKLRVLDLSKNALSGSFPVLLASLTELTDIYLNNNTFTGKIPKSFENLTNLKSLHIQYNKMDDIEADLPQGLNLNITYQTIERDVFYFRGDTVEIELPRINLYAYPGNTFTARNTFYVYIDEGNALRLQATEKGTLRIPSGYLANLQKNQKISIRQYGGTASETRLNYKTTSIQLQKIPTLEYEALVAIYNAMNGPRWSRKWTVEENNLHEGVWLGVSIENGHVVSINLHGEYYLAGTIPSEIGNLPYLRYLNLSRYYYQYLTGEIPAEIGKLTNLEELHINDQQLSGELPKEIGSLTKLKALSLYNNQLTGDIPAEFSKLINMHTLNLAHNSLSGTNYGILPGLPELTTLYLYNNLLSGALPKGFESKLKLNRLDIYNNQLDDIETTIASGLSLNINSQVIQRDTLYYKGDTVEIELPRICLYNYSTNTFTAQNYFYVYIDRSNGLRLQATEKGTLRIPKEYFFNLRKEQLISIDQNGGTASGTRINYSATSISTLKVPDAEFDALVAIYNAMNGPKWNRKWNVTENNLHEGAWLGVSIENGHVVSINLHGEYYLAGTIPPEIGDFPYLRYLNLSRYYYQYITGEIPAEISKLTNLEELHINDQQLSGELTKEIGDLTKLKALSLYNNQFSGDIPAEYGKLINMHTLNLAHNSLSGTNYSMLPGLPELTTLYLYNNLFSGALPKEFESRLKLNRFDIYNNRLDDIETTIASGLSLNINSQVIQRDTFYYKGDTVEIELPRICLYNYGTQTFDARNYFYVYIDRSSGLRLQATEKGTLRIPKGYFSNMRKEQLISIDQSGGTASGTRIEYAATSISTIKIPDSEYNALVAIYNSMNGPKWNRKWTVAENNLHEGTWQGVTIEDGHVVSINLHGEYYLAGTIPAEIGDFPYLRYLNLCRYYYQYLTGEIPAEIGKLTNLEELHINEQRLSGSIPKEIGNLKKLRILSFQYNLLSGNIPEEFAGLESLQTLYLNNNWLEHLESHLKAGLNSLNLNNQTIVRDTFYYKGDTVEIELPNICLYDYSATSFSARNNFIINYNGATDITLQATEDGTLRIPGEYLNLLRKNTPVSIRQQNGYAAGTTISFTNNSISLPKIPTSEYDALVAIYNSLNGKNWSNRWDISENNLHEGPWYGIGMENGHVVSINLSGEYYLSGEIPPEIGDFPYLRYLNLNRYSRYITGEIPVELGRLTNLEELHIANHRITGNLTFWLDKLSKLRVINMSNNQLSGPISASIEKLYNIQHINLSQNQLSGSIPDLIGNLQYLTHLYLNSNQLSGSIPASLNYLPSIRVLYLQNNQFDALEKALPYQSHITVNVSNQIISKDRILLSGDYIVYDLPLVCRYDHAAGNFRGVNRFGLYINNTHKVTVESTVNGKLRFASVYFSGITENDKISIQQENGSASGSVINFDSHYTGTPISDEEYQVLMDLYNSTDGENWNNKWDVGNNDLHLRMWYGVVIEDGHIIKLDLQNNNLNGTLPSSLSNLTELRQLSFYNNSLSGEIPGTIGDLHKLEYLLLYKNKLTGSIPANLYSAGSLIEIQLQDNQLSGDIPEGMEALIELTRLNISKNNYSGSIPLVLFDLPAIKELDLSYNKYDRLGAAFNYLSNVEINIQGQTIDIPDYIYTEGTLVKAELANINFYNHSSRDFDSKNTFEIYVNGVLKGESKEITDNIITFIGVLNDYQEGQEVFIVQRNGSAYGSTLHYAGVEEISQDPIAESEYKALVEIFKASNGEQWSQPWDVSENNIHEGGWKGVSYNNGHIIGLNLENNNLTGQLADVFDALPELANINMSQNKLSGKMPQTLIKSDNLKRVILADNQFSAMDTAFAAKVDLNIARQSVHKGDFPLSTWSMLEDSGMNRYDHTSGTFANSQTYMLIMGSYSTNITLNDQTPFQLVSLRREWNVPNGQLLELNQTKGSAMNTRIRHNLVFKNGDSNMDGVVNVLDIQQTVNYTFKSYTGYFNYIATDLNNDKNVNVLDIVRIATEIQNTGLQKLALESRSSTGIVELSIENGILYMTSSIPVGAFDIRLTGVNADKMENLLTDTNHQVAVNRNGNETSIIAFSLESGDYLSGKFAIAKVGDATFEDAVIADADAQPVSWNFVRGGTGIEGNKMETGNVFNYPNPFTGQTTIKYTLDKAVKEVSLKVVNVQGQLVHVQNDLGTTGGEHSFVFHQNGLPTGTYYYTLEVTGENNSLLIYKNIMMIK